MRYEVLTVASTKVTSFIPSETSVHIYQTTRHYTSGDGCRLYHSFLRYNIALVEYVINVPWTDIGPAKGRDFQKLTKLLKV